MIVRRSFLDRYHLLDARAFRQDGDGGECFAPVQPTRNERQEFMCANGAHSSHGGHYRE